MKKTVLSKLLLLIATIVPLNSCFKEEPLNTECDIEKVVLNINEPEKFFFRASDSAKIIASTDSIIIFDVRSQADLSALAPRFKLTDGATIEPRNGSVQDFSRGDVRYTVTSEDGNWHRNYTVRFTPKLITVEDTTLYDFENFELDPSKQAYYIWFNKKADGSPSYDWASGNAGYYLSMGSTPADKYPTAVEKEGYKGNCVKLTTCSTGFLGQLVNKRMAAGNLYLGKFDLQSVMTNQLKATQFGIPFDKKPMKITGYYKYTPGKNYQKKDGTFYGDIEDQAAIYAVFYRNEDAKGQQTTLHGDDVKTSEQIVAIADMGFVKPAESWTEFEIPFQYKGNIDMKTLKNMGYSLTIVFSSSKDGDVFCGAIGSTLLIDEVKVISTIEQ